MPCSFNGDALLATFLQGQFRDFSHYAFADSLIRIATANSVRLGEMDRFSNDDGNLCQSHLLGVARESFVGAENSHRDDGHECFGDDEAEARLGGLQIAIGGTGALGKNDGAISFPDQLDDGFERTHVGALLIDGDDVYFRKNWPKQRPFKECLSREEKDRFPAADANHWGIKEAGVVCRVDDAAFFEKIFPVHDLEPEKDSEKEGAEPIADEIPAVHGAELRNGEAFEFQPADDFPDDTIDRKM